MDEKTMSEALEAKLTAAQTMEDVIKAFAEEGIEVTRKQLEEALRQYQAGESGELGEDALDAVAGGAKLRWPDILRPPFFPFPFPLPLPRPCPRPPRWPR